ncbi:MAG: LCP family protein [Lachnospiraceae bacterium]|jgi:LCP family protein required for cell wall assembly
MNRLNGTNKSRGRKFIRLAAALIMTAAFILSAAGCASGSGTGLSDFMERVRNGVELSRAAEEASVSVDPETGESCYDLLLIGTDRRSTDWNGNSDAVMLVTINYSRQTITLTSFMRDLEADIPGVGIGKLNSSYAEGGAPLLVSTLVSNFGVDIDNYIAMDFNNVAYAIDVLGGVDAAVTPDEARVMAKYLDEMGKLYGFNPSDYYVAGRSDGGTTHLNGFQAVAYDRVRYVGNGDFERTARQREEIINIISGLKNASAEQIAGLASACFTEARTDISDPVSEAMLARYEALKTFTVAENRVPYDGHWSYSGDNMAADHDYTVSMLQQLLYQ